MKKKLNTLGLWCLVLALGIFVVSYFLYHHTLPSGAITLTWQPLPGKPFVTELVAELGVLFLFAGLLSLLIRKIFFR